MRLTELNPRFYNAQDRRGIGMHCDCPCGCDAVVGVAFSNPLDGLGRWGDGPHWVRTGDTFETMTLDPSILNSTPGGCGAHGYFRNGAWEPC